MTKEKEFWDTTKPDPLVVQASQIASGTRALDIGAGSGRDAIYLAKEGFDVTATDADSTALNELRLKAEEEGLSVNTIEQDVRELTTEGYFDVVVCDMVLHFLKEKQEVSAVIERMKACTAAGGVNVVTAYTDKNQPGKRPYLFAEDELKNYYSDWRVVRYEEKPTPWFQLPGEDSPRKNEAVYLLAVKV